MNFEQLAGVVVGLIVVLCFVKLVMKLAAGKKSHPELRGDARYDERQIIAQGVAYKYTFWAMVVYSFVYAILGKMDSPVMAFFRAPANATLGAFIGCVVYGVVCIAKDAYMGIYDKPMGTVGAFLAIIFMNLVPVFSDNVIGELQKGVFNLFVINLYAAVAILVCMIAFLIKLAINKKEEELED